MKVSSIIVAALLAVSLSAQAKHIELSSRNTVAIQAEVDDESMAEAQIKLMELVALRASAAYPIYIVLDSPGGSITAGLNFIDFAKSFKNVETVTLFAASMAAGIVEALPGTRNITSSGILMFHRAKGGVQGQFEDGELESELNFFKGMVRGMEVTNATRMNMSLSTYKSEVKDELWILGSNAVSKKAADAEVTASCTMELSNKPIEKEIEFLGNTFRIQLNGCPLIKSVKLMGKNTADLAARKEALKRWLINIEWRLK